MNIRSGVLKIAVTSLVAMFVLTGIALPAHAKDSYRAIVVYKKGVSDTDRTTLLRSKKFEILKDFKKALDADVVADMTDEKAQELLQNPSVERVEKDIQIEVSAQTLPWGVDRIDAEKVWGATTSPVTGAGIKVAVIDTGID